jgi:acetate kinase
VASVVSDAGETQPIGPLRPGDTFGEMSLMTGDKTMADVIAVTRCQVLQIPASVFSTAIVTHPPAVQHLARTISERLRNVVADPALAARALRKSRDPYGLALRTEEPQKVLVINCGSSSLKYNFYDTADSSRDVRGVVERIGSPRMRHVLRGGRGEVDREIEGGDHETALREVVKELTSAERGVLSSPAQVTIVGHRVVHGGERFAEAVVITDEVLREIDALAPLAPLHNPVNSAGIRVAQKLFPAAHHVAVFDTAFHHTIPSFAYLYGLPYEYYEESRVRRYGFHGMSHLYVGLRSAEFLKRRFNELELVTCHLGNGASVCAIDHGRSIDTSMGLTPAEGLIMGTRCGDIDPGALAYLARIKGFSLAEVEEIINKKSGLLGLSGISNDMREVEKAAEGGHHRALLALNAFAYRVRKYIGAYAAAMGGLDAIVFTGGIGQGSAGVRSLALQNLGAMGIHLDEERNRRAKGFEETCRISTDDSPIAVLVIPTDEERMIARESLGALSRTYAARIIESRSKEPIPLEVSAHHVHLTQEHVEVLFGKGHQLTWESDLSQPGQFASKEQVALLGPRGSVDRVRVLGPVRKATQVEIAMTEQFKLGVHPPIRESGDLKDTPGITMEGTAGKISLDRGVICALRHIHMSPEDALRYGLHDKSVVRVRVQGDRELIFGDVLIRVDPSFRLAMHIDTDEANAANIRTGAEGHVVGLQSQA